MQEHFVNKTHFFKFLSMTDKPLLGQLKTITASRNMKFSKAFYPYKKGKILTRKGRYPAIRINTKSHQFIKPAKISYSIVF